MAAHFAFCFLSVSIVLLTVGRQGCGSDRSKAVSLLKFFYFASVISYMAFVVSLFVPNFSIL